MPRTITPEPDLSPSPPEGPNKLARLARLLPDGTGVQGDGIVLDDPHPDPAAPLISEEESAPGYQKRGETVQLGRSETGSFIVSEDFGQAVAGPLHDEPGPGETCERCHRAMPATALEVWLEQHGGMGFDGLAELVTDHPIVIAWFEEKKRKRPRRISKNLVWRLNHQAPWWSGPRPSSPALPVQAAMLEITGLKVEDLQNLKPHTDGYSCKVRESEYARLRRVKREAREESARG